MKTLSELCALYPDRNILIACYNEKYDSIIMPQTILLKNDLTVWHNCACIINAGMKDHLFLYEDIKDFKDTKKIINQTEDLKLELFKIIDSKDHLTDHQKRSLKNKRRNKIL